jgi:hypothetical protein
MMDKAEQSTGGALRRPGASRNAVPRKVGSVILLSNDDAAGSRSVGMHPSVVVEPAIGRDLEIVGPCGSFQRLLRRAQSSSLQTQGSSTAADHGVPGHDHAFSWSQWVACRTFDCNVPFSAARRRISAMRSREGMAMTLPVRQKKQKKLRPNWRIAVLARGKTNRQGWNHAELNTPSGPHRRRWYCWHNRCGDSQAPGAGC